MTLTRRVLLLWLFMFWQGGFMFYGTVVVPIGTDLLTAAGQGDITRQVTHGLNISNFVVLVAWIADLVCEPRTRLWRRWGAWLLVLVCLAALVWLHVHMDANLDLPARSRLQRDAFRELHRWYLRVSTVQWVACIALTVWTLQNWRASDQIQPPSP
jgi:hypothetical protein